MKIIVDTNIVFSALLNTDSHIASILFNPTTSGSFYSLDYLIHEIENRRDKLVKYSKLTESQLAVAMTSVYGRISFISTDLISPTNWKKAYRLCHDIDEDDTPFLALTLHLDGILWTGDRKLSEGLSQKGFTELTSTEPISETITDIYPLKRPKG